MDKARLRRLEEAAQARRVADLEAEQDAAPALATVLRLVVEKGSEEAVYLDGRPDAGAPAGLLDRVEDPEAIWRSLTPAERSSILRDKSMTWNVMLAGVLPQYRPADRPGDDAPLLTWAAWYWPAFDASWRALGKFSGLIVLPNKRDDWAERFAGGA